MPGSQFFIWPAWESLIQTSDGLICFVMSVFHPNSSQAPQKAFLGLKVRRDAFFGAEEDPLWEVMDNNEQGQGRCCLLSTSTQIKDGWAAEIGRNTSLLEGSQLPYYQQASVDADGVSWSSFQQDVIHSVLWSQLRSPCFTRPPQQLLTWSLNKTIACNVAVEVHAFFQANRLEERVEELTSLARLLTLWAKSEVSRAWGWKMGQKWRKTQF